MSDQNDGNSGDYEDNYKILLVIMTMIIVKGKIDNIDRNDHRNDHSVRNILYCDHCKNFIKKLLSEPSFRKLFQKLFKETSFRNFSEKCKMIICPIIIKFGLRIGLMWNALTSTIRNILPNILSHNHLHTKNLSHQYSP